MLQEIPTGQGAHYVGQYAYKWTYIDVGAGGKECIKRQLKVDVQPNAIRPDEIGH